HERFVERDNRLDSYQRDIFDRSALFKDRRSIFPLKAGKLSGHNNRVSSTFDLVAVASSRRDSGRDILNRPAATFSLYDEYPMPGPNRGNHHDVLLTGSPISRGVETHEFEDFRDRILKPGLASDGGCPKFKDRIIGISPIA